MIIENKKGEGISAQISTMDSVPGDIFNPEFKFLLKNDTLEVITAKVMLCNGDEIITTKLYPGWNPEIFKYINTEEYPSLKYSKMGACRCGSVAIELDVKAGLFDFSYNMVYRWVFADGSESTESRPTRTLSTDQSVKLYVNSFTGELNDNNTDQNYIGNVSAMTWLRGSATMINTKAHGDVLYLSNLTNTANFFGSSDIFGDIVHLANLTNTANFANTKVTGDIIALSNITNYANFSNTEVSGDIVALSNVINYINFSNTKVFGDIAALNKITNFVNFDGTEVTGDIVALSKVTHTVRFYYTNVTGDVASLSNVTDTVNLTGTKVHGDIVVFKNVAQTVSLGNTNVTGDISNLQKSNDFISLQNCSVSGVLNPKNSIRIIYLDGTNMTSEDTLQSLRNMNSNFTTTKTRSIQLVNNIDPSSTEVIAILDNLVIKGCTVIFV